MHEEAGGLPSTRELECQEACLQSQSHPGLENERINVTDRIAQPGISDIAGTVSP